MDAIYESLLSSKINDISYTLKNILIDMDDFDKRVKMSVSSLKNLNSEIAAYGAGVSEFDYAVGTASAAVKSFASLLNGLSHISLDDEDSQSASASQSVQEYSGKPDKEPVSFKSLAEGLKNWPTAIINVLDTTLKHEKIMSDINGEIGEITQSVTEQQKKYEEVTAAVEKYAAMTQFSRDEAAGAEYSLLRKGMSIDDTLNGGLQSSLYFSQAQNLDMNDSVAFTAKLSKDYGLKGEDIYKAFEGINSIMEASKHGFADIGKGLDQTAQSASRLGINAKDAAAMLAVLRNTGAGNSSGDYLEALLGGIGAGNDKDLKKVFGSDAELFDENGQIKSAQAMADKLRKALVTSGINPESLFDKNNKLLPDKALENQFKGADVKRLFDDMSTAFGGAEGRRAALSLTAQGNGGLDDILQKSQKVRSLNQVIAQDQETLNGKLEAFEDSISRLMSSIGNSLLPQIKELLTAATGVADVFSKWIEQNPEIARNLLLMGIAILAMRRNTEDTESVADRVFGRLLGVLVRRALMEVVAAVGEFLTSPVVVALAAIVGGGAFLGTHPPQRSETLSYYSTARFNRDFTEALPDNRNRNTANQMRNTAADYERYMTDFINNRGAIEGNIPILNGMGTNNYYDNRNITYNVRSTDPVKAANEIQEVDKKYVRSRTVE